MEVIELNEHDRDIWDREIVKFAMVHPLNAFGWGVVRSVDGWRPHYYVAKENGHIAGMMMVLEKRIPIIGLSILYAPKGPVWDWANGSCPIKYLLQKIIDDAKKPRSIFLRIDPNIPENIVSCRNDLFTSVGFNHLKHRWSFWNSPRDLYRIDLTKAEGAEGILNTIDRDARRCIRKAQNEGVTIRPAENLEELQKFFYIFSQFSVDKGFMSREYVYQETLWREYVSKGNGRLFLAIYNEQIIGGLICLLFGNKCLAMHMGTPYEYHKLHTYYAYIWESIKWAKENGCEWYSFRGTGTTPTQESFKRKFNPKVVSLIGYYDFPIKPKIYKCFYFFEFKVLPRIWRLAMKLRKSYKWVTANFKSNYKI